VGILYSLPKNWKWATLEKITDTTSGGTPKRTNKDYWNGSISWLKSGELNDGYIYEVEETITEEGLIKSSAKVFKTGTLLMAMYGATVGRLGILKVDTSTNQAVCAIFNRFNLFSNEYIFFYLKYTRQQMLEDSFGGAQPNLSQGYINNINIPFAPINEQKRIVTKIEKLFSNLDKSDQHLAHLEKQLKRYRQSVLKSAFEGELTREWREKQTDLESANELLKKIKAERITYIKQEIQEKFKDKTEKWLKDKIQKEVDKFYNGLKDINNIEKPFDIPTDWKWVQWEQILKYADGSFKRGPFGSSLKKAFFVKDTTYKVYEQYCPINDDCSFERYYISEDKFLELKSFEVKEKDYLISCSGSIGKITQIPREYKNGVINQALLRVRINNAFYLDKFFITLFRSKFFQDSIIDNSTGSAMINVKGVKELKALPLPMLSIGEQKEIIKEIERHFSIIDKLEAVVQKSIKESKRLRQSILKQAFEGKLVEQDSNDESATILLEKIAKAKEEYKKQMKKGKKKSG